MVICSIPDCKLKEQSGTNFFAYPFKSPEIWKKWKTILNKNYGPDLDFDKLSTGKICSQHFETKFLEKGKKSGKTCLKFNAIPTKFGQTILKSSRKSSKNSFKLKLTTKYENVCRLCLKEAETSQTLTKAIKDKIELLISCPLNSSPELPSLLCSICSENILNFIEFRKKILENESKLTKDAGFEIKQEEIEEDTYEEIMVVAETSDYFFANKSSPNIGNIKSRHKKSGIKHSSVKKEPEEVDSFNELMDFSDGIDSDGSWKLEPSIDESKKSLVGKYGTKNYQQYMAEKQTCTVCQRMVHRRGMKRHLASIHKIGELKFCCDICGSRYFDKRSLGIHIELHKKPDNYKCEFCPKSFKLSVHKISHENRMHKNVKNRTIYCHECAESYITPQSLERHLLEKHKKEAKLSCDFPGCTKTFFIARDKFIHQNYVHSGPQKCDDCETVCASISALKKHKKQHEGNAYYCTFIVNGNPCNKVYYEESKLKVHSRVHSDVNSFRCSLCPAQYKNKRPLTMHYIAEHSTFRFNCLVTGCDANFTRKDYLRNHVKAHHSNLGEDYIKQALQRIKDTRAPKLEELKNEGQ